MASMDLLYGWFSPREYINRWEGVGGVWGVRWQRVGGGEMGKLLDGGWARRRSAMKGVKL